MANLLNMKYPPMSRKSSSPLPTGPLRRRILTDHAANALLIFNLVPLEQVVCVGLRGRFGVGVVEKILDAKQNLLDRDGWFPRLFLVENRQADGTRGVDVGVEQRGNKFACRQDQKSVAVANIFLRHLHFGGFVGYSEDKHEVSFGLISPIVHASTYRRETQC